MLKAHLDARENALVAMAKVSATSGHGLHKGTPREVFIREFLSAYLPESVAIGTGEIIDANSRPSGSRNQFDIVIYNKNYPKLDFGGGISGFLIESVLATIEVKSTLTRSDMQQAISAARNVKQLTRSVVSGFRVGYIPPSVINYVVAYKGPAQMATVYGWIGSIHAKSGIVSPNLPTDAESRQNTPAPSIDGVFVLNKGFVYFDNVYAGFSTSFSRTRNPTLKWIFSDGIGGNLLLLFIFLHSAASNINGQWLNPVPYLSSLRPTNLQGRP